MTDSDCTDDQKENVWNSHLIIIFVMTTLNSLGSAFILWTWMSNKVLRSKKALRHIVYKSFASIIMATSYFISYGGYVRAHTWKCDLQAMMQAISCPTVLVSECAIAIEIVRIVNNLLFAQPIRPSRLEDDNGFLGYILCLIYPVFIIWGIVATIVPFFVPTGVGSYAPGAGQFCWFDLFWERLVFFYAIEMVCVVLIVVVLVWLHIQLHSRQDIKCMGTTLGLLRTLSIVYILTWTPPLIQRISEQSGSGLECNKWFEYVWDFTITGGGFVDALIWFRFPIVQEELCRCTRVDSTWSGGTSLHRWTQTIERQSSLNWFPKLLAEFRGDQVPQADHPYHSLYDSNQISPLEDEADRFNCIPDTSSVHRSTGFLGAERRESEVSLNNASFRDEQQATFGPPLRGENVLGNGVLPQQAFQEAR